MMMMMMKDWNGMYEGSLKDFRQHEKVFRRIENNKTNYFDATFSRHKERTTNEAGS